MQVGSSQSPLQGGSIKRPRRPVVTIFCHHCIEGLQSPTVQADGMDLVSAVEPDGQALCQFVGLSFCIVPIDLLPQTIDILSFAQKAPHAIEFRCAPNIGTASLVADAGKRTLRDRNGPRVPS